jgi:hypothetical protein
VLLAVLGICRDVEGTAFVATWSLPFEFLCQTGCARFFDWVDYIFAAPQKEPTVLNTLLLSVLESEEALMNTTVTILCGWTGACNVITHLIVCKLDIQLNGKVCAK